MGFIGVASLLVAPLHRAFAPEVWNADLDAAPITGKTSKAIALSWDSDYPEVGCTPTRLMIRFHKKLQSKGAATAPTDTNDDTFLGWEDPSETSRSHNLLHAYTNFAYTIFACTSATGCSSRCNGVINTTDSTATEREKWLVTGVNDYDEDTDVRILDPGDWQNHGAPELFRYKLGDYDDQAGLYFRATDATSNVPDGVYVVHTTDTTWQDDWNASGEWGTPVMIASGTNSGDLQNPKNMMVVPTLDASSNPRLRLFWTSYDDKDDPTYYTLNSALASDPDGDEFGLCCSDTADCSSTSNCTLGDFDEVCCDYDDAGADVREEFRALDDNCLAMAGWHGHDLRDDMGQAWDPDSDELTILFSGDPDDVESDCLNCTITDPNEEGADIDMWHWDTGGGCDTGDPDTAAKFCLAEESWNDPEDSGTSWCPERMVVDAHDPFAVAYLDEKKVYRKVGQSIWIVGYTNDNGRTFEDTSAIEFYFEDDDPNDTGMDSDDLLEGGCVEDPTSIIWKDGTNVHEMMVFVAVDNERLDDEDDHFRCFCTQDSGVSPEDSEFDSYPGFLSAILWNG